MVELTINLFLNGYPHFYLVRKFLLGVRLGFSLFAPALKRAGKINSLPSGLGANELIFNTSFCF